MTRAIRRPSRKSILFVVGLVTFVYEVASSGVERPTVLLVCVSMMGLPGFLYRDETHPPPALPPPPERGANADV